MAPEGAGSRQEQVECLGRTFPSDEARRAHYREELRQKLRDPSFRRVEGFPEGTDEDILSLSDPPYYTACPNPFLPDFVAAHGRPYDATEPYRREPFAGDVTEGKNDALYRLPSYHTKVPPGAIRRYLEHYTRPGDLVLDAFCGSGMTGLACLTCGAEAADAPGEGTGGRHAILVDLSPAATFTASVMNSPLLADLASGPQGRLGLLVQRELGPLYHTSRDGRREPFDYAVWSDWGDCSECGETFRLFDAVIDPVAPRMRAEYPCPACGALLRSESQGKSFSTVFDEWLGKPVRMARTTMVMVSRRSGQRALRREAQEADARWAEEVGRRPVKLPPAALPYAHMTHQRNNLPEYWGITHVHHLYTRRNYYALSEIATLQDEEMRRAGLFCVSSLLDNNATRRNRFYVDGRRPHGSPVGPLSHTMYVPTLQVETNVGKKILSVLQETRKLRGAWPTGHSMVSTQSATHLGGIPDDSVDFVFTDPPFGGNIHYSEQNFLVEWWLRVFTNHGLEAITSTVQGKDTHAYQELMTRCFREYHRVLKPGRWMVVEFHNSSHAVWAALQHALEAAGFVVATVALLDKVHSTLHQDHKAAAVDKDLAITVYKPVPGSHGPSALETGTVEGAWDFARAHLAQLPVFRSGGGQAGAIAERQDYLLFDRMVAFHVQRGATVPLSAGEFYAGLAQRFPVRDGMFFLPEQAAEHDRLWSTVEMI